LKEIKKNPWLASVDWEKVEEKSLPSPFLIDPKKAHFDATHDLEELLLEDNPLRARERNPKQDINKLSSEYRQMEEKFHSYDFTRMERKSYFTRSEASAPTTSQPGGLEPSRPATPGPEELICEPGDDDELADQNGVAGVGDEDGYDPDLDPLGGHELKNVDARGEKSVPR